jgi:hypothetical protein
MGLMDKVKAQANTLAQKTQETAREGKARIDQAQANRHADLMLRNLGALVYAEQTGRGTPQSQDQIAKLIGDISSHEAQNGINLSGQPTGSPGGVPPQGSQPEGPGGQGSQPGGQGQTGGQPGGTGATEYPPEAGPTPGG